MALSKIVSAIALLIISQFPANAQVPTSPDAVSATKARNIGGYELGMAIGDQRNAGAIPRAVLVTPPGNQGLRPMARWRRESQAAGVAQMYRIFPMGLDAETPIG